MFKISHLAIIEVNWHVADVVTNHKRPKVRPSPASHLPRVEVEAIQCICAFTAPIGFFVLVPNFHVVIFVRDSVVIAQIVVPRCIVGLDASCWETKTLAILNHVFEKLSVSPFVIGPVTVNVDSKPDFVSPRTCMHSEREGNLLHLLFGTTAWDARDQLQLFVLANPRRISISERPHGFVVSQTIAVIDAT